MVKIFIRVSLSKEAVHFADNQVKLGIVNSRSHAINNAIKTLMIFWEYDKNNFYKKKNEYL